MGRKLKMKSKGLTLSIIFEAESANYGEGIGNITSLKKISRGSGNMYTYISRQALRYNIINQMEEDKTPLHMDKTVIQFAPDASIKDYAEIDLFGYMKTIKSEGSKTRAAVVRLSNAVSLESYNSDLEFLTNKGLYDRYIKQGDETKGGNIAQSEIHRSYYTYTITIDLEKVGIDENDDVDIDNEEKAQRVNKLLKSVLFLYRDIKGRRENLSPLFVIGGLYDIKNPFFENSLKVEKNNLIIENIKQVLNLDEDILENTLCGLLGCRFDNASEIKEELKALDLAECFNKLYKLVNNYYLQ